MAKCPYTWLEKDCPETREGEGGCQLWDIYPREETNVMTGNKVVREVGMCTHSWQTKIAYDAAGFTDYAGKSVDKLRSLVKKGQEPTVKHIGSDQMDRIGHGN